MFTEEENGAEFVDLKKLLSESDFVIVLCELNKGTANVRLIFTLKNTYFCTAF